MKNMGKSLPTGGAKGGDLPGFKKNKTMNAYAEGGMVGLGDKPPVMTKGKARGGGAATKGLGFQD